MSKGIDHIVNERKRIKSLEEDLSKALAKFPGLSVIYWNDTPIELNGNFKLVDDQNREQENWDIRIIIPKEYPYSFPVLYEVSEKIKRNDDHHIDKEGKVCLEFDIICEYIAVKGITICKFIDNYVFKYFCWVLLYQHGFVEVLDFWKHNHDGIRQFFYEELNANDDALTKKIFSNFITNNLPERNDPCLCGKNKKYKHCHWAHIEQFKKYPKKSLAKGFYLLYGANK